MNKLRIILAVLLLLVTLLGSFIFSWFLAIQQNYFSSHPREMKELLSAENAPC